MKSFFTNVADAINIARLNHFKSLNLTKKSDRVIEVGCGPVGFFTKYLEKNVKEVISVDARQNLIEEHVKRHPHRRNKVGIANLNEKDSLKKIGKFDLCFCYGLLYHLSNPAQAIENIASTSQMVVISTICSPVDNGEVNFTKEDKDNDNQSYDGDACRPARDWIMKELKKHYQFVY
nr:methyltransferase domain-containing protein [Rickettsiales bacterium]